jgi:8-oxo-dGTP pyrophosphatase MutT (NUDIX family)
VCDAAGRERPYATVRFKRRGCVVVPVDAEGCTALVGQWRFGVGRYSWEVPAGGGRPDEAPEDAARRELGEETGLEARHGWSCCASRSRGRSRTSGPSASPPGGCRRGARPDPQEVVEVRRVPFAERCAWSSRGRSPRRRALRRSWPCTPGGPRRGARGPRRAAAARLIAGGADPERVVTRAGRRGRSRPAIRSTRKEATRGGPRSGSKARWPTPSPDTTGQNSAAIKARRKRASAFGVASGAMSINATGVWS